jgi:DNA-binding transcriptional LysR family regulator
LRYLALKGVCLTELPPFYCRPYFERGELVEVLPDYAMPEQHLSLVFPSGKNLSRISRVFIDYCAEHLTAHLAL